MTFCNGCLKLIEEVKPPITSVIIEQRTNAMGTGILCKKCRSNLYKDVKDILSNYGISLYQIRKYKTC